MANPFISTSGSQGYQGSQGAGNEGAQGATGVQGFQGDNGAGFDSRTHEKVSKSSAELQLVNLIFHIFKWRK